MSPKGQQNISIRIVKKQQKTSFSGGGGGGITHNKCLSVSVQRTYRDPQNLNNLERVGKLISE